MLPALIAGDTLAYTTRLPDYPASAGWVLSFRLTPRFTAGSPSALTFSATASGDDFVATVLASVTAGWAAGDYTCSAWVTKSLERYSVTTESGAVTIAPNPVSLTVGTDTRSDTERALVAVTALISGKATSGMESYKIAGRELRSYPLGELIKLQAKLRNDLAAERLAAGLVPGRGSVQRIFVRVP